MRVRSLIIPLVATAALLAGCASKSEPPAPTTNGVENLEADAIIDRAEKALLDAGSFHVQGSGSDAGEAIEVDVVFQDNDKSGTITASGITFDLLVVGGDSYFKGDADFWSGFSPDEDELALLLPLVEGKWVLLPGGQGFDLEPGDVLEPEGTVTKGDVTTLDGKKVIILKDDDGSELYVALEGEPYPLQIVDEEGTITFTEIGEEFTIEAPAEDEIFDLSTFTG